MGKASKSREKLKSNRNTVRVSKSFARNFTFQSAVSATVILFICAVFLYIGVSGTIARLNWTNLGVVPVSSPAFPGGYAQPGTEVYVSSDAYKDNFIENTLSSLREFNDVSLVEVKAGPYGSVKWEPSGLTVVNNVIVDGVLPKDPGSGVLDNQYIVTCVEGACEPGLTYIVDSDDIFGVPFGGSK